MKKAVWFAVVLGLLIGLAAPIAWAEQTPAPNGDGTYVDITSLVFPGGPAVAQAKSVEPGAAK